MNTLVLLSLMISGTAATAAEKYEDFNAIVKRVESHYGKRHMKVPFMGLITAASHFTRPAGVSDLKLAIIEGVGSRLETLPDFHPGPEWKPVIRTTSRNGEHMVMYGRDEGGAIRTLIVTVERDEAVVMQMRLDPSRFAKFVEEKSRN